MNINDNTKIGNSKKRPPDDYDYLDDLFEEEGVVGKTAKVDPFARTIKDSDNKPIVKAKKKVVQDDLF